MIFTYLTLSVSIDVMENIDVINSHKDCIIYNINVNPDGSLIYPVPIDPDLIVLTAETPAEEKLLISEVSANSFYYDAIRMKYLDLSETVVSYYIDGTNKKNQFMYQIPGIASSLVPFKVSGTYCITGYTFYSLNIVNGDVVTLKDSLSSDILPVNILNTNFQEDLLIDQNITDLDLSSYINNTGLDTPVLKLYMRRVYNPAGA